MRRDLTRWKLQRAVSGTLGGGHLPLELRLHLEWLSSSWDTNVDLLVVSRSQGATPAVPRTIAFTPIDC